MEKLDPMDHKFLNQLSPLTDEAEIFAFGMDNFSRKNADGLITLIIKHRNYTFGIIYNDFKVNGGSFGKEVSKRAISFIEYLDKNSTPLVYLINSIGVRLMEGRGVFNDAFNLLPAIENYKKNNLLMTANIGKSLGLGALILSLGHYRYSLMKDSEINITGPDVIKLFFGKSFDFKKLSAPKRHQEETLIVQELYKNKFELLSAIKSQIEFRYIKPKYLLNRKRTVKNIYKLKTPEQRIQSMIVNISDSHKEVFAQLNSIVKTFLIRRNGQLMGVFINPPGQADNMITIETLEKYSSALDFFHSLKIPIISFLDTPGASPFNLNNESKEVINYLGSVALKIMNYKYGKSGFVIGRSYGGATVLGFTKNFGAHSQYIVKGSHVGIMHKSIIEKLLTNSKRLFSIWKENESLEKDDFSDLISNGTINELIDYKDISSRIDRFQAFCHGNRVSDLNLGEIYFPAIKAGPMRILRKDLMKQENKHRKNIIRVS